MWELVKENKRLCNLGFEFLFRSIVDIFRFFRMAIGEVFKIGFRPGE